MQQHNPLSHSILCPALQETLDAFETRELDGERADAAKACPDCRCVLSPPREFPTERLNVGDWPDASEAPGETAEPAE